MCDCSVPLPLACINPASLQSCTKLGLLSATISPAAAAASLAILQSDISSDSYNSESERYLFRFLQWWKRRNLSRNYLPTRRKLNFLFLQSIPVMHKGEDGEKIHSGFLQPLPPVHKGEQGEVNTDFFLQLLPPVHEGEPEKYTLILIFLRNCCCFRCRRRTPHSDASGKASRDEGWSLLNPKS